MSNRSLLVLSFITLVIIVAAVISSKNRAPLTEIEKDLLFPGMKDRINDIAAIDIEDRHGSLHITRQNDSWLVTEADNYPARFDKVKKLVLDVADMFIVSRKTNNASLFHELGVEEPTDKDSRSFLLTFKDTSGATISSIIAGDVRTGSRSTDNPGQYVRKSGSNDTFQINGSVDLSTTATDWIDHQLLSIADERILETKIEHANGATVTLSRAQGEGNFTAINLPKGKESRSFYFTNQPGTFLSNLNIENVKARSNFTLPETATKTTIRTYDGLIATIFSAMVENINYVTMDFSVDEALIEQASATDTSKELVIGDPAPAKPIDVRQESIDLNSKVANWVFTISSAKFLLLTKQPEELIVDIGKAGTE